MADNPTGTPVTLVVTQSVVPATPPPPSHQPSHLPRTGFEVTAVLLLAVLLLAIGTTLTTLGRPITNRRNS